MKYITGDTYAYDIKIFPPPFNTKINLITKYGVQVVGTYSQDLEDFYIAWYPLIKIPITAKNNLKDNYV